LARGLNQEMLLGGSPADHVVHGGFDWRSLPGSAGFWSGREAAGSRGAAQSIAPGPR
jgi:hypothetical protein